jgi:hypothetical protein
MAGEETTLALLQAALGAAVPLWIVGWRGRDPDERLARGRELSAVIAEKGDVILYRGKKKGESARAFNALAESIAILSFQPGGVTLFGLHFETKE